MTLGITKADGKKFFQNKNYDTIDALAAAALRLDRPGTTVYHAIGSFSNNEVTDDEGRVKINRKAAQAVWFKTLACDIDVGETKPYKSQREAAQALANAVKAIPLPTPMVVSSGYGLHCYWPLTEKIGTSEWLSLSVALRDKLGEHSLQIDTGKVCDPSMVLRPVGTTNRKSEHPLTVKMLRDCPDYTADQLRNALGGVRTAPAALAPAGAPRKSAMFDAVLAAPDYPPADAGQLVQKCGQLEAIATSRGAVQEPLWYLAVGTAAYCVNSEAVAIRWSDGHPDYTEKETLAKMEQWRKNAAGPATCAAFEKISPEVCKKCAYKGKIVAPVQLSVPVAEPTPAGVDLPGGYQMNGGRMFRVVQGVLEAFCDFPLIVKERRFDRETGKAIAVLEARMPVEGVKELELPIDTLAAGKDKWTAYLFNNSIAPGRTEKHIAGTRQYLMTYLEELQRRAAPTATYGRFGWMDDDKAFVLGHKRYAGGAATDIQLSPNVGADMRRCFATKGTLDEWKKAAAVYGEPGLEHHAMCLLMSMGTPLMKATGLQGMIIGMYDPGSGTGKTTTGHMVLSVWGHPSLVQIGKNDTANAMYNTITMANNVPVYFDEITNMPKEQFSDLAYSMSSGRERRRLDVNAKLREAGSWNTNMFASSNSSLVGKLEGNKLSSGPELQRLIEYPFIPNPVFNGDKTNPHARGLFIERTINANYGHAGHALMLALTKVDDIQRVFDKASRAFENDFKFTFDAKERFKQAAHVTTYIAAQLATRLGLISFDFRKVIEKSITHTTAARVVAAENASDAFDVLGMFSNEHTQSTIFERTNTSIPTPRPAVAQEFMRGEIRARFEVTHNGKGQLSAGMWYIDRAYFNRWCQERGVDGTTVVSQLKAFGVNMNATRISLGRRTQMVTSAVWCVAIDLMHHEFVSRLSGIDQERNSLVMLMEKSG